MIALEFLDSPDRQVLGPYVNYHNRLVLGASLRDDIIIRDQQLGPQTFIIQLTKEGLLCGNYNEGEFYLSNGKKISGLKTHYPGDQITIGATTFQVVQFAWEEEPESLEALRQQYQKTVEKHPEMKEIFNALEKELLYLQELENKTITAAQHDKTTKAALPKGPKS
jgi:hypothetical protein